MFCLLLQNNSPEDTLVLEDASVESHGVCWLLDINKMRIGCSIRVFIVLLDYIDLSYHNDRLSP